MSSLARECLEVANLVSEASPDSPFFDKEQGWIHLSLCGIAKELHTLCLTIRRLRKRRRKGVMDEEDRRKYIRGLQGYARIRQSVNRPMRIIRKHINVRAQSS